MKLHSDTLTFSDIQAAVPENCYLAVFDQPGFGRTRCYYEGSRSRTYGFIMRLAGSSKYNMRNLPDKAATYEEWGEFLSDLFNRDPQMIAGRYKGREHFHNLTDWEFFHSTFAQEA